MRAKHAKRKKIREKNRLWWIPVGGKIGRLEVHTSLGNLEKTVLIAFELKNKIKLLLGHNPLN